jgi:fatty acid amide hydrolase
VLPSPEPPASAADIARQVAAGRVLAADVLAASLRLHEEWASRLNGLVQLRRREAEAEATAIDDTIAKRASGVGPLAGVPVSVKECFAVCGLATTLGILSRRGLVDGEDAEIVRRVRAAGAVVIGKANVPQAMYLHETDNPVWGLTRHPLDATRGPGGSSGGDAALVAAGVVPLGIGNDLAGSLRQPANACGIAAIMPRTAALGEGGGFDTLPGLQAVRPRAGFLARTVDDLGLAVAAIGAACPAATVPSKPRRVAWWDDTGPIPPSPAVSRAVHEAVARLESHGLEVVRVAGDIATEAAWLLLGIVAADGGDDVRRLFAGSRPTKGVGKLLAIARLPRRWRPFVAAVLRLTGNRSEAEGVLRTGRRTPAERAGLIAARDTLATRFSAAVTGCDAVVCPVSAVPALRQGSAARLVLAAAPCLLANLFDLPAGAVPVTTVRTDEQRHRPWSLDPVLRAAAATDRGSAGLPVGVQVVGCPGRDETTVLHVMRLIEAGRERPTRSCGPR